MAFEENRNQLFRVFFSKLEIGETDCTNGVRLSENQETNRALIVLAFKNNLYRNSVFRRKIHP